MQPPPHPCSARSLPGDNDSWQEEEEGGGRGSWVGGGVEPGSSEDFTPFYRSHCLLRSGQGQVAGGGKRFKFSVKKTKKQKNSNPSFLWDCLCSASGRADPMFFRWTDSPNTDLLHRQGTFQLPDTFLMTSPFGSPLMDPRTTKEASSLYGLCLKACVENSLLCSSYMVFFSDAWYRGSAQGWGTSVRHMAISNRKFKTVFQNGLSI